MPARLVPPIVKVHQPDNDSTTAIDFGQPRVKRRFSSCVPLGAQRRVCTSEFVRMTAAVACKIFRYFLRRERSKFDRLSEIAVLYLEIF